MSILPVITYPHKVLRTKCKPIGAFNNKIIKLIDDMIETMHYFKGCVGVSAPQVGRSLRIIVVDVSKHGKSSFDNHGLIALVNPVIIDREGTMASREGCLSIPDYTGNVERAERIKVKGKNINGKRVEFYAVGFESIAIQHEFDHLEGILFIDRISSLKTDLFLRKSYFKSRSGK